MHACRVNVVRIGYGGQYNAMHACIFSDVTPSEMLGATVETRVISLLSYRNPHDCSCSCSYGFNSYSCQMVVMARRIDPRQHRGDAVQIDGEKE